MGELITTTPDGFLVWVEGSCTGDHARRWRVSAVTPLVRLTAYGSTLHQALARFDAYFASIYSEIPSDTFMMENWDSLEDYIDSAIDWANIVLQERYGVEYS